MANNDQIFRILHDANGSLQGIVTFLEFLEDQTLPAEVREDLEAALSQSETLINQLRELRRLLSE